MTDDKLIDHKSMTAVSWVKGKGWVATGCIPLEDAIRSYRDRPSMERELADLREFKRKFEAREDELEADNANLKRQLRDASGTIAAEVVELKGKCERLEASRKATLKAGWDAAIDTCAVKYGVTKSMFEAWWDAQTINEGVCE
jgi:hypothetical protein